MKTLQKNPGIGMQNLINSILYAQPFESYATRHGIATEPHAKKAILRILKNNNHKSVSTENMGTVISSQYPFISASPDLKVNCKCCEAGLVEIKCPYNIRDKAPIPSELNQLIQNPSNTFSLKHTTDHYCQIQGQLGITKLKYCYYFVFTHHGYYLEKIPFNETFYKDMLENVCTFWFQYLCREILFPSQSLNNKENNVEIDSPTIIKNPMKRAQQQNKGKQKKTKSMPQPVYLCGTCSVEITSNANTFQENSIKCEICSRWFHFGCIGINEEEDIRGEDDDWMCKGCDICFSIHKL